MTITTTRTPEAQAATTVPAGSAGARRPLRHAAIVAVPLLWVIVALAHPMGGEGTVYDGLHDKVALWIGVHLAQLVFALALSATLWTIVRDLPGASARIARWVLPVHVAFFAAFDSVAGFATGLAVQHANSTNGAERDGAISTADYLMENSIAGNNSLMAAISTCAFVLAIAGTAMALRQAGASRATWTLLFVGLLLATHAGPLAAIGLVAFAGAFHLAHRDGLA